MSLSSPEATPAVSEAEAFTPFASEAMLPLVYVDTSVPSYLVARQSRVTRIAREASLSGRAADDAVHVAIAATKHVEYLVTWNCKHLANPRVRPRVLQACERAGYESPSICTPEALLMRVVYAPASYNRNQGRSVVLRPRIRPLID